MRRLDLAAPPEDPAVLFRDWWAAAGALPEREAMALSTVDREGKPDTRMVYLKGVEQVGARPAFVFYTNYLSKKAQDLEAQPACALLFYWGDLYGKSPISGRQVRIHGQAERLSPEASDRYFASRSRASQLGAWASLQSQPLGTETLSRRWQTAEARFSGRPVPRPPHWGGYRVVAERLEFWLGQPARLHDRVRYQWSGERWTHALLFP